MEKYLIVGAAALAVVILAALLLRRPNKAPGLASSRPSASGARRVVRAHWLLGVAPAALQGKAWHVGERTVTLGRGVGNYIQVLDESVSRIQCQLVPAGRGLLLTDKGGRGGTLVNGAPVESHTLVDGDVIRVGQTELIYRSHGDFGVDQGMLGREVGARAAKPTQHSDIQTVGEMLQEALRASRGDTEEAAKAVGMRHDFFLSMMHKQRIDPDDYK